jgi:leucyl aminopeptidase
VAGKGICFDSGGLDIKPAGQFADMKFDKCGACAVLGILRACAELKLPVRVVGLLALAENLPSGRSYKPSDVLKIGDKTVEVANTDAEGRVVLADALAYAQRYQPRALVDLATLTGAIVSALGDQASGVMGTDQELLDAIGEAGRASGERVWPLPLWPEYVEQVKGEVADLKNLGASGPVGRGMAGAIAGAAFLKHFADPAPWVHVDIAGTSDSKKGTDYLAAGASGVGVRLVTELLRRRYASAARRR